MGAINFARSAPAVIPSVQDDAAAFAKIVNGASAFFSSGLNARRASEKRKSMIATLAKVVKFLTGLLRGIEKSKYNSNSERLTDSAPSMAQITRTDPTFIDGTRESRHESVMKGRRYAEFSDQTERNIRSGCDQKYDGDNCGENARKHGEGIVLRRLCDRNFL